MEEEIISMLYLKAELVATNQKQLLEALKQLTSNIEVGLDCMQENVVTFEGKYFASFDVAKIDAEYNAIVRKVQKHADMPEIFLFLEPELQDLSEECN